MTDKKVSEDLELIRRAFDENDPDAIRAIFRNDDVMRDESKPNSI